MPPRIAPHRLPQPSSCQCFRTRPSCAPPSNTRQLHPSPNYSARQRGPVVSRKQTGYRQKMFTWLNGPGKVFKEPLPNSTNYLSAYDRQGNLIRKRAAEQRNTDARDLDGDEEVLQQRDREAGISETEILEASQERLRRRRERDELEARDGIPKERQSDLRPYPMNPNFSSQAVLSEELREKIYELVVMHGVDIKGVSGAFGVDVRRVAAVVRLKTIEKQWMEQGKTLAKPYSKAVLAMLPTTPYDPKLARPIPHESINDVPVHPATRRQLFVSTSESREFTRADAAKEFHPKLLPADERIVHTELLQFAKWEQEGISRDERVARMQKLDAEAEAAREEREKKQKQWEQQTQVTVPGRRWDFKFQDFSAEKVGKDGRRRGAVGLRYGMPHEDRKRGQYKLPQKVE